MDDSTPEFDEWDDDDDFEEFDTDETAEDASETHVRLPEATWAELVAIVIGAGGSAKRMDRYRLWLEAIVEGSRTTLPSILAMSKENEPKFRKRKVATAKAANALIRALENEGEFGLFGGQPVWRDIVPEFQGDRIEIFAAQLKLIRDRAERDASRPRKGNYRLDRDLTWNQIVCHWKDDLRLPVTTAETAPLLKFILVIAKEMPWLKEQDLDPENVRAYLRKWKARQSDREKPKGGKSEA